MSTPKQRKKSKGKSEATLAFFSSAKAQDKRDGWPRKKAGEGRCVPPPAFRGEVQRVIFFDLLEGNDLGLMLFNRVSSSFHAFSKVSCKAERRADHVRVRTARFWPFDENSHLTKSLD